MNSTGTVTDRLQATGPAPFLGDLVACMQTWLIWCSGQSICHMSSGMTWQGRHEETLQSGCALTINNVRQTSSWERRTLCRNEISYKNLIILFPVKTWLFSMHRNSMISSKPFGGLADTATVLTLENSPHARKHSFSMVYRLIEVIIFFFPEKHFQSTGTSGFQTDWNWKWH